MEHNIIFEFLNFVSLQIPGLSRGPLGSANPIVKGMIPSALGIMLIAIGLNLFNAMIKRKMVDQDKVRRLLKETRAWQKNAWLHLDQRTNKKLMSLTKNLLT